MGKRYLSLDILRGLSIFGMIFSAIIPYGVLPAWMYHIQNPPPSHALDMSVPGIGWVDLVFPVFIFCMGVAIPLSGRRGSKCIAETSLTYVKGVVERFVMLWLFSYLYVLLNYSNVEGFWPQFFTIAGFGALFLIYYKYPKPSPSLPVESAAKMLLRNRLLKYAGFVIALAIMVVGHFCFGEFLSVQRRGIIIFLLAFLYLFGSLIWHFTRDRLGVRALIFALLFIFTHITRLLDWPEITYANPNIRWWFNMEYFYFLLLLIPATVVGDILYSRRGEAGCKSSSVLTIAVSEHLLYPSMFLFVVWQCYALYMGITLVNVVVSVLYMGSIILLLGRKEKNMRTLLLMAGVLIVWGVVLSAIEGGMKKVPCTISYCLATCGISILLLLVADYICKWLPGSLFVKVFSGAGQNPLMSYIAFDSLVVPFMKATGIISFYTSLYSAPDGNVALGLLRAAVAVLFTMWLVSCFSRKGIFWKA